MTPYLGAPPTGCARQAPTVGFLFNFGPPTFQTCHAFFRAEKHLYNIRHISPPEPSAKHRSYCAVREMSKCHCDGDLVTGAPCNVSIRRKYDEPSLPLPWRSQHQNRHEAVTESNISYNKTSQKWGETQYPIYGSKKRQGPLVTCCARSYVF